MDAGLHQQHQPAGGKALPGVGESAAVPDHEGQFAAARARAEAGEGDLVAGVGPILIWDPREKKMQEIYRVLRPGGAALVGGKYLYMPDFRKVSSETLRQAAANTGISSIRISDDMGQWVEVRKGIKDRGLRD